MGDNLKILRLQHYILSIFAARETIRADKTNIFCLMKLIIGEKSCVSHLSYCCLLSSVFFIFKLLCSIYFFIHSFFRYPLIFCVVFLSISFALFLVFYCILSSFPTSLLCFVFVFRTSFAFLTFFPSPVLFSFLFYLYHLSVFQSSLL